MPKVRLKRLNRSRRTVSGKIIGKEPQPSTAAGVRIRAEIRRAALEQAKRGDDS